MSSSGALIGLLVGIGVACVISWLVARHRPTVLSRVAPDLYLSATHNGPMATLVALVLRPRRDSGFVGLEQRLQSAGRRSTVAQFRMEQTWWTVLGALVGCAIALVLGATNNGAVPFVLLGALGAMGGYFACDRRLTSRIRTRMRRLDQQLPACADLLAFAVAAGESPSAALSRVADTSSGDLADELRATWDMQRSGASLETALRSLAGRASTPSIERFVDGMCVSIERGTPIADVLRAQAADARAEQRRMLMEKAGRKDVFMLIPIVFLILPVVVVIAVFPGFTGLQLLVP